MSEDNVKTVGGIASILMGVLTILGAAFFVLQVPILVSVTFTLFPLLTFAVIPAVAGLIPPSYGGWVQWTSKLAYLGLAAMVFNQLEFIAELTTGELPSLEPVVDRHGWLAFGATSVFFLTVNFIALREKLWPTALSVIGFAGAIANWLAVGNMVLMSMDLRVEAYLMGATSALVGGLLWPIWSIWMGWRLLQETVD